MKKRNILEFVKSIEKFQRERFELMNSEKDNPTVHDEALKAETVAEFCRALLEAEKHNTIPLSLYLL